MSTHKPPCFYALFSVRGGRVLLLFLWLALSLVSLLSFISFIFPTVDVLGFLLGVDLVHVDVCSVVCFLYVYVVGCFSCVVWSSWWLNSVILLWLVLSLVSFLSFYFVYVFKPFVGGKLEGGSDWEPRAPHYVSCTVLPSQPPAKTSGQTRIVYVFLSFERTSTRGF